MGLEDAGVDGFEGEGQFLGVAHVQNQGLLDEVELSGCYIHDLVRETDRVRRWANICNS